MDTLVQALVMGIVQGLTEFLPVSSSGHLIVVPFLFGWDDPFLNSLAFSVMLHIGTLAALLVYFRADWMRLVPAGLAAVRDRSFGGDPDRRLAWLLVVATIPGALVGLLLGDLIETGFREIGLVAVTLVVGGGILWLADRTGARSKGVHDVTLPVAIAIGAAQALALVPGISRSGISISAARFAGLDRAAAARFSFLMATPITAGAVLFEVRRLASGEAGVDASLGPLVVGMFAAFVSGALAISVLLRYLAEELARRVRRVSGRAGRARARRLAGTLGRGQTMEVMKQHRQRAIRDLVEQRPIRTQQELAAALRERGFRTTQATITRDVAELGLIKVTREGTAAYALPPRLIEAETSGEDRLRKLLADLPVEFHEAGLLLVVRTLPGSAHAIAAALDRARWPEVAGSIAGDDTLFVAFPDRGSLQRIKRRLLRLTEGG